MQRHIQIQKETDGVCVRERARERKTEREG